MLYLLLRAGSGTAAGIGGWFSLGALAFRQGPDGALTPLGLLPPIWALPIVIAAGAGAAMRWQRPSTGLLWLPVIAAAPWLGGPQPALAMWSGALVVVLWALVLLGSIPWQRLATGLTFRASLIAGGAAMAAFTWAVWPSGLTGDQPHYLLIATSVLRDGDFDLANDYLESRQAPFYPGPLDPWHVVLSPNGRQYSFHGAGVALLTLPAFAFAGAAGAKVLLLAISIATASAFAAAAGLLTGSRSSSCLGLAALVLQFPFIAQSSSIYPEAPAAAVTSLALLILLRLERGTRVSYGWLMATGAALAFLPWLHLRFASIAALFAIAILWLVRQFPDAWSKAVVFMAAPVISAALLFATTFVMFETFDVTAPFRQKAEGSLANAPAGVLGMLVDAQYGLLVYAPALVFAAAGAPAMFRRAPITALSGWTATAVTLVVGASYVWWGGTSTPARFLVAVLPVPALAVAAAWSVCSGFWRTVCAAMVALGAVITIWVAAADRGAYLASVPDGRQSIFEWANRLVDLRLTLPSLVREGARPAEEAIVAAVWIVAGAIVFGTGAAIRRGRTGEHTPVVAWCVAGWISLAASAAWTIRAEAPLRVDRAQLSLVQRSSRPWLHTGYAQADGLGDRSLALRQLEFAAPVDRDPRVLLYAPMLPSGRYLVVDDTTTPVPVNRNYSLELGREAWPLYSWTRPEEAPSFATVLPLHSVRVTASGDLAGPPPLLRLRVLDVYRSGGLPTARRVTRYEGLLVYSLDAATTMETGGFWLPAERRCALVIGDVDGVTTPAVALTLETRSPARIILKRGAWTTQRELRADASETIALPASRHVEVLEVLVGGERSSQAVWTTVKLAVH